MLDWIAEVPYYSSSGISQMALFYSILSPTPPQHPERSEGSRLSTKLEHDPSSHSSGFPILKMSPTIEDREMKIKPTLGVLMLTSIFINFAYAEAETTNVSNETTAKQPAEAQDAAS